MANSIADAFRNFIGIKKEERKEVKNTRKSSKKKIKVKEKKVKSKEKKRKIERKNKPKKNIEKEKKKKLKEMRLENLEKAREKRSEQIAKEREKEEKEREKEERINKSRLRNLKKARKERSKKIEEERKEEERVNEIRLDNLERGREKRMKKIEKEKRKEERLNRIRNKNLKKARKERSKELEEDREKEEKLKELRLKNLKKARKKRMKMMRRAKRIKKAYERDKETVSIEAESHEPEYKVIKPHEILHKKFENKELTEQGFVSYDESVPKLLRLAKFEDIIRHEKKIILKPNLTLAKAFPVTTDPLFVEEIIKYIKKHNQKAEIIIAEGSGGCETKECFKKLGYDALSEKYKVALLDLNEAETIKKHSKKFKKYSFIEYPKVLLDGFLISLPVLKGHKEAKITFSLKNMLGCFPARHYGGNWKVGMHKWPIEYSIHDILVCKMPDYAICDASIALLEHEINGYPKEMNLLLAGNPLEVDKKGALLLGYDWKRVPHLVLADELERKE